MEKLIIKVPGTPARVVELPPGIYKLGRAAYADVHVDHASVSGSHCEITISDGAIAVKDLGSTNGTWIDGRKVDETPLPPGQCVRVGEVELEYPGPDAWKAGLKLAAVPIAEPRQPASLAPYVARLNPPKAAPLSKNFYRGIPGAFLFPFKGNGWILLVSGTVLFGGMNCLLQFRILGFQLISGLIGGLFSVWITGYVFAFLQSIITSTAMGENNIPSWPQYEGWWDSAIYPYLQLLAICAVCAAPAYCTLAMMERLEPMIYYPVLFLGFCYAPMALLAVAMDDSVMGLNPLLVIPSILRVPREYLASCGLLALVLSALTGLIALVHYLLVLAFVTPPPPGTLPIIISRSRAVEPEWILTEFIAAFLILYFAMAEMRLIGLLYYTRREKLGWGA